MHYAFDEWMRRTPFVGFLLAISDKATKKIRATVRNCHLSMWGATRTHDEAKVSRHPSLRNAISMVSRSYQRGVPLSDTESQASLKTQILRSPVLIQKADSAGL